MAPPKPSRAQPVAVALTTVAVLAIAGSVLFWDAGEPATGRVAVPDPALQSRRSPTSTTAAAASGSGTTITAKANGGSVASRGGPSSTALAVTEAPARIATTVAPRATQPADPSSTNAPPPSPSDGLAPRGGDVSGVSGGLAETTR